jgi:hypothetical protein
VLKWQKEVAKCEIKDGTLAECNLEEILAAIENSKMPSHHLGREIQDFIRISEFKVEARWTDFVEKIDQFNSVVSSIEESRRPILSSFYQICLFIFSSPNIVISKCPITNAMNSLFNLAPHIYL